MKWSEEDLAYAAGFLDGEGCFVVGKRGTISISCHNTYRPVITWLKETFGGVIVAPRPPRKENHRAVHVWQLAGGPADELCKSIAPYLKEKANQALLLIALKQTTRWPKVAGRLHPDTIAEREHLGAFLKGAKRVAWN